MFGGLRSFWSVCGLLTPCLRWARVSISSESIDSFVDWKCFFYLRVVQPAFDGMGSQAACGKFKL
jgi:hypothetical protein